MGPSNSIQQMDISAAVDIICVIIPNPKNIINHISDIPFIVLTELVVYSESVDTSPPSLLYSPLRSY